ncbi:MAG TPA: hypothetical protein VMD78_09640 [Candidatus Baltobacteraceae bacterium]|nr:hypothetical protein [Candidatus Baltobacteraceae bacterium]
MQRPTGVTILAVLAFCGAGLLVLGALAVLFGGVLLSSLSSSGVGMMAGVGAAVVAVVLVACAGLDVAIGVGLLKLQNWARVVTIVLCALFFLGSIFSIFSPFHTHFFFLIFVIRRLVMAAIYAWILWYLFQPNVKQAFGTTGF